MERWRKRDKRDVVERNKKNKKNLKNKKNTNKRPKRQLVCEERSRAGSGFRFLPCTLKFGRSSALLAVSSSGCCIFCGFSCAPSGLCLLHGTAPLGDPPPARTRTRAHTRTQTADAQSKNVPVVVFNCVSPDVMSHFLQGFWSCGCSRVFQCYWSLSYFNNPPSIIDLWYWWRLRAHTEAAASTIQRFIHIFVSVRSSRWIYVITKQLLRFCSARWTVMYIFSARVLEDLRLLPPRVSAAPLPLRAPCRPP